MKRSESVFDNKQIVITSKNIIAVLAGTKIIRCDDAELFHQATGIQVCEIRGAC